MKFIEPALDRGFDDGYRGADPDKAQKAYRDRYAWAIDIRDFFKKQHHQQLQKARQEAQTEYKQFVLNVLDGVDIADGHCNTKAIRLALQSRII